MTVQARSTDKLPLSVLLFHAAMARQQSLSEFAKLLDVGPISLRQFILGKTQRPRTATLEKIGQILNLEVDEVRQRMDLLPETSPQFGDWLGGKMTGRFSRARLTKETKISDGALRNYLANQTLPDSDQAQRLAEALDANPIEIAQIIVANQVVESGGVTAPPSAPADEESAEASDGKVTGGLTEEAAASSPARGSTYDEDQVLNLWRRLHPQGRRATLQYIAGLLVEG